MLTAILRGRVKVVPRFDRTELPALLKGYHVKLFPTLMEGFGKALVEAMACGLAPIVTSTPGPLEIVQDGRDALVVTITDRAFLDRLRRNAHAKAQAYSWSQLARQRLQLYEEFSQSRELGN